MGPYIYIKETIMNLIDIIKNELCFIKNGKINIASSKLKKATPSLIDRIISESHFLDRYNPSITDRIKYILNNISEVNRCKHCNKEIVSLQQQFCSKKCNNNSEQTKSKFRDAYNSLSADEKDTRNKLRTTTVNTKYGGYTLQSPMLSKKMRSTMVERYGVEHSFQNDEIKQRVIQNWIKKYGVDNPFKVIEIKDKIKKVLFERYGVTNAANVDPNRIDKTMQSKVDRGLVIPDQFLSDYELYRKRVKKYTEKTYKKYKHTINPHNYKRVTNGNDGYQLDHKYSIMEGFINDISPESIGSVYNLEMLYWKQNLLKSKRCSITKEELIKLIKQNESN